MKTARTIYNKPELDYRVNQYTLKCLVIMLISVCAIWIANILGIFIVEQGLMARGVSLSVIPIVFTLILSKFIDLHKRWVKYMILFNTILAITIIGSALTYHTVLLSVIPLLIAAQYVDEKIVWYVYILTILSVFAMVMLGYYYGLCDANMLVLTAAPVSHYVDMITHTLHFELKNTTPWITLPLFFALPRCILLLLMLPVIRRIFSNSLDYAEYAADMKERSEKDDMTGLYNRNKYLEMKEIYYPKLERIGVFFWDINSLKYTNDTLGHEKGDYLIKMVAECILKLTKQGRKAYRIGGDEFLLIMENPGADEMEQVRYSWEQLLTVCEKYSEVPCSVAVGTAVGAGKNIDRIIKEADEEMYRKKKQQKMNS